MTATAILDGRLRIAQPADGYRFAVDSLLLAWFVLDRRGREARGAGLELGGGCGVVSAAILAGGGVASAELVELQEVHHRAAIETARLNGLEQRMRCHHRDLREVRRAALDRRPDLVWSNPPFHPVGEGRTPPDPVAAAARHEVSATMADVLDAAARILPSRGWLYLTYPASRLGDLLAALPARRFAPTHLCLAWADPGGDASRLLLEARKEVETPLRVGPAISMDGAWAEALGGWIDGTEDRERLSP
jgi:tRNA1Val (adenine37-N6)-methyltransferase